MRKHAGITVHKRTTVTGIMTKHKYFMYLMLSKSSGSQRWKLPNQSTPGVTFTDSSQREKQWLCHSKLARPACLFLWLTNVHFRTRKSREELDVFTAALRAALQSSCHLHHKWRASILYSGCKYLWSACSEFLNCHITWACPGSGAAPERGKTHRLAPSSVPVRPKKDRRGSNRDAKDRKDRVAKDCGRAARKMAGAPAGLLAARKPPPLTAKLDSAKPGRANATWHLALFAQLSPRAVQTSPSTKIKASPEGNTRWRTCHHVLASSCFAESDSGGDDEQAFAAYLLC